MAKGDINQRIGLTGGDDVKKTLNDIAASGDRVGPALRQSLGLASGGLQNLHANNQTADRSTRQLGFAITNLSFQANDVATSLASGASAGQVFAQQAGQIFQAFQQGGGLTVVLKGIGDAILSLLTPTRGFIIAGAALAGGIALIVAKAVEANNSTRQFDVTLQGLGKNTKATGAQLEDAAQRLRQVGLSITDARKNLLTGLQDGIDPTKLEKVVEIGANLNAVFGKGTLEQFVAAVGQGGAPLQEFAVRLGLLPRTALDAAQGLDEVAKATDRANKSIRDVLRGRQRTLEDEQRSFNRSLLDQQKDLGRSIVDLTREKGTQQQELEFQNQRRIGDIYQQQGRRLADIDLQTNRQISDIRRERFDEYSRQIKEFNKKVEDDANKFSFDQGAVDAIGNRVNGLAILLEGPVGKAINDLSVSWNKLLTNLSKSEVFVQLIKGLTSFVELIAKLLESESGIPALVIVLTVGFLPALIAIRGAILAITLASGPWGIAIGLISLALLALVLNLDAAKKKYEELKASITGTPIPAANPNQSADNSGGGGGDVQAAGGGFIRGPGTAKSDSIAAWLSTGEFVVNAFATRKWLPMLHAINRGLKPRFATGGIVPKFATGGLVTQTVGSSLGGEGSDRAFGAARTPINLTIGDQTFNGLSAPEETAQQIIRVARRQSIRRTGRMPGWYSG